MVYLLDSELSFIERRAHGALHIGQKPLERHHVWWTYCGRHWQADQVSELTTRESEDNDPDCFVCRLCKARAPDGMIRIEE